VITNTDTPAISVKANSTDNKIFYNTIKNATEGIKVEPTSNNNLIYSNNIINTPPSHYSTSSTLPSLASNPSSNQLSSSTSSTSNGGTSTSGSSVDNLQLKKQTAKNNGNARGNMQQQSLEPSITIPHSLSPF
jgi:hypothetical protein